MGLAVFISVSVRSASGVSQQREHRYHCSGMGQGRLRQSTMSRAVAQKQIPLAGQTRDRDIDMFWQNAKPSEDLVDIALHSSPWRDTHIDDLILTHRSFSRYRTLLDRSTPLTVQRWLFTGAIVLIFLAVVLIRQGVSDHVDRTSAVWLTACFRRCFPAE